MDSLSLLDEEEIAAVLPQLNIYKGYDDGDGVFKKDDTPDGGCPASDRQNSLRLQLH